MNQLAQEEISSSTVVASFASEEVDPPDHNLVVCADRHAPCRSSRTGQPTRTSSSYSFSVQEEEDDDQDDDQDEEDEEEEDEEDDPVWVRNRYALELMRVGMYGRAASHLKEALQLVRMDTNKTTKKKVQRAPSCSSAASATTTTTTTRTSVMMSLQPYHVGQGPAVAAAVASYHHREPLAFHPFLRGMELVEVARSPGEDDAAASSAYENDYDAVAVAAVCYNLGMVHQLMAIQLSHELHLQEQEVVGRRSDDHTLRHRLQRRQQVVEGCYRKSLRFYELATATTAPLAADRTPTVSCSDDGVESMEQDESCCCDESDDDDDCPMTEVDQPTTNDSSSSSSSSYLLLNVALWANMGHNHYFLRETDHVRRCADQLCLALHVLDSVSDAAAPATPATAPQPHPTTRATTTRSSSSVLLMPLAMNVLLYSQIRNPAPCA